MYKNSEHNKPILCSKCLKDINPGDLYYLDNITSYCIDCRTKQIKKIPGKRFFTGVNLAPIGGKRWKKQVLEALKVKSFNFTPSKNIYDVLSHQRIAGNFGTTLKPNNTEKAQLFLIELQDQGKL